MKKTQVTLTLLILCTGAFAKQKLHVYDLSGTVAFSSYHSDSEAHITVNGETYDSYCSTTGTSISCTDSPGAFVVTFADGSWTTVRNPDLQRSQCCANPVLDSLKPGGKSATFQYRMAEFRTILGRTPFFCVGFSVLDKHGNSKAREACYEIASTKPPASPDHQ